MNSTKRFGNHHMALASMLHLTVVSQKLNSGPFKDGVNFAIEEIGAYLDGDAGDGQNNLQTLAEQVVGIVDGYYGVLNLETREVIVWESPKEVNNG